MDLDFYDMTSTFDLMTFNVSVHRLLRDQKMNQIQPKTEKSGAELTGSIVQAGLISGPLGGFTSPSLTPLAEFKLLTSLALACSLRHSLPAPYPKTLGHNRSSRHPRI